MKNMKKSRGFCLIELIVAMTLAVMVLLLLGMTFQTSSDLMFIAEERVEGEERLRFALHHHLARDLRRTSLSQLTIAPDGKSATFRVPVGFNGATKEIIWSDPITYSINPDNQLVRSDSTGSKVLLYGVKEMALVNTETPSLKNFSFLAAIENPTDDHKRLVPISYKIGITVRNGDNSSDNNNGNNHNNNSNNNNSNNSSNNSNNNNSNNNPCTGPDFGSPSSDCAG